MQRWISVIVLIAVVASATMGCGTPSESPTPTNGSAQPGQLFPNWPPLLNDFRFHWSAEPGIDVTTGPAMIVRAYVESYNVAAFTLNPDNVYPGFYRATPESRPREGNYVWQLIDIRPLSVPYTPGPDAALPRFGYEAFHFLELAPLGNGYRALVCRGNYATFLRSETRPGKFTSAAVDDESLHQWSKSGVHLSQIELTQHDPRVGPNPPAPVTVPQRGPAPAPDQDVFGNWFITGANHTGRWGRLKDGGASLQTDLERRCEEAMPEPAAERVAMMTTIMDQPPPHGSPIPGWPVKAN